MAKKWSSPATGEPNLDLLDVMPHAIKRFRIRVLRLPREEARRAIQAAIQDMRWYPGFKMERQVDGKFRARIRSGELDFIGIFSIEPDGRTHVVTIIESPTVRWVPTKETITVPDVLQLVEDYEGRILELEDKVTELESILEDWRGSALDWEAHAKYWENLYNTTPAHVTPDPSV